MSRRAGSRSSRAFSGARRRGWRPSTAAGVSSGTTGSMPKAGRRSCSGVRDGWRMFWFRARLAREGRQGQERPMRVIGIDPGLRRTGWGIIDLDSGRPAHVANGVCEGTGSDLAERLLAIFEGLAGVIARFAPAPAAVEKTFVNKDAVGTLKLGQARGIALLVPARAGLPVAEYAPNEVKKVVVGVGHADKA